MRLFKSLLMSTALSLAALTPVKAEAPSDVTQGNLTQNADEVTVRCGSIDLVFLIDTTFSLALAIGEMKRESVTIVDLVEELSEGKFRLGLVAFDDSVRVVQDLNAEPTPREKAEALRRSIKSLRAAGGGGGPEASDEAVNTAVNTLPPDGRAQEGTFSGDWEAHTRILVLITDNVPGGFDDLFEPGVDDRRALAYADDALSKDIRISVVHVPTNGLSDAANFHTANVLRGLAAITGGLYAETLWSGQGTAEAVLSIMKSCGANRMS